jgi:hypothetical protein
MKFLVMIKNVNYMIRCLLIKMNILIPIVKKPKHTIQKTNNKHNKKYLMNLMNFFFQKYKPIRN